MPVCSAFISACNTFAMAEETTAGFPILNPGEVLNPTTQQFKNPGVANKIYQAGAYTTKAFTNLGNGDQYFLYSRSSLALFDIAENKRIGLWSLEGEGNCASGQKNCASIWWAGRWSEDELLEQETKIRLTDMYHSLEFSTATRPAKLEGHEFMGCIKDTPLRYGDINGDGKNEIVVLIERQYSLDWIIFSVESKKNNICYDALCK